MNQSNRLEYIDTLKGVAIILVLIGHIIPQCFGYVDDPIYRFIYSFHMPLFIFISGYLCALEMKGRKRVVKSAMLLQTLTVMGVCYSIYASITINDFWQQQNKYGYWYLWDLSVFSMLLPIPHSFSQRRHRVLYEVAFSLGVMLFFLLLKFILPNNVTTLIDIDGLIHLWPFFILGSFVREYKLMDKLSKYNYLFSISVIGYIGSYCLYLGGVKPIIAVTNLCAIYSLFFLLYNNTIKGIVGKLLAYFGEYTLYIYIFHFFITRKYAGLYELGQWFYLSHNYLLELLFLIVYAIIIGFISIFIGKLIKKSVFLSNVIFADYLSKYK